MHNRRAYLIHDAFTKGDGSLQQVKDFQEQHLPDFEVDAYLFDPLGKMQEQVAQAVDCAIKGRYDLVLLDVYFGTTGKESDRLGIDLALPVLAAAHLPVIVISSLEEHSQVLENFVEVQRTSNIRYLPHDKLHLLRDYAKAIIRTSPEHHADIGYGFRFRTGADIRVRKTIEKAFDDVCLASNSEPLEVPLAAPVANFLGPAPRPLSEKDSNKLFAAITTDGKAMAVRYEGTALTAKFVGSELESHPEKSDFAFHYLQEMVRVEFSEELDEQRRFRSFFQAGFECFTRSEAAHFENIGKVCSVTASLFSELGLPIVLRLSHVRLVPLALGSIESNWEALRIETKLRSVLARRIIGGLEKEKDEGRFLDLLSSCQVADEPRNLLLEMFRLRGCPIRSGIKFLQKYAAVFGEMSKNFARLLEEFKRSGIEGLCQFDPGIYRSLSFYSGFTMQGDVPASAKSSGAPECLGGGDFTGLVESFGVCGPVYSFGMAVGVDRLISILKPSSSHNETLQAS